MKKKDLSKFLKEKGFRLTKERSSILQKILSLSGHFDPEDLYLQIKKTGMKGSRASVYRTLNVLCECGIIERIRKTDQGSVYEQTFGHEHHDHMHCLHCGATLEFFSEQLEKIQDAICKKQGFRGTSHTLEIRGYCKKCQKKLK